MTVSALSLGAFATEDGDNGEATIPENSGETSSPDEDGEIDVAKLERYMMADKFIFSIPEEGRENLLSAPVVQQGDFASLTNTTRMQVLYDERYRIDAMETAYLTYKLTNNSSDILSLGTMVYFGTVERNLCAYVLKPLVYDAKTGAKLNLKTSYEYKSGQFVLTNIMPTVEIPPHSEVYIAIPFISADDATFNVPGLVRGDVGTFKAGKEPQQSVLWSNNSERTELMKQKLERDGTTDCLQLQLFLGGNGTDANGARRYAGNFDFQISELYAVSKTDYYERVKDLDMPSDNEEEKPEVDEKELEKLLMANKFIFKLPNEDTLNVLSETLTFKGIFPGLSNTDRMKVVFTQRGIINSTTTAFVAYKIKNNSDEVLNIGTMVYFSTTGKNLCALTLNPMIFDATTGKKLKATTSYSYKVEKFVLNGAMPTIEIPPNSEVYVAIPFVSVDNDSSYVPGMVMATDDGKYSPGDRPKQGNLWSNSEERTQLMQNKIDLEGSTDCMQMQIFLGGNGADANGARKYDGGFDFEISQVYAVSKDEYYPYAYENKDQIQEEEEEEKPPIGVDPDGGKYTTISMTDSGLAMTPSFDVNGNILNVTYTRSEFQTVARTLAADGFNRVYVVTTRTGIPAASSASNQWNDPGDTKYHIAESIILTGDPNFEILYACKQAGLEVIAVFKPYEGGGVSKGTDADMSNTLFFEETVGGYWTGYDAFLSAHPEMRLSRKEDAEAEAIKDDVVTKITATFILEEFTRHRWTGGLERITPQTENRSDIKLYISKNNLDYVEYEGDYTLTFKVTKAPYLDENGWVITEKAKCFEACIEGIEIGPEYQYMALATEDVTDRYIIPQSMIRIYNAKGDELPTTVCTTVRYGKGHVTRPAGYIWGAEEIMRGTERSSLDYFKSWGFEFDFDGNGSNYDRAYYSSYVYGIARGNFDYAKGTYCEAYDEVREYWLYEIENLLALGYDGIEIRLQAHSSMYSDYAYYGFNEPLMQAYIAKYGTDPREEKTVSKETAYNIACLRGEFFMDFMKRAEELVHGQGKIFGFQMRSAMLDSSMDVAMNTALHQMFCWAMPKIIFDWKEAADLCDTITIKQNFSNNYRPELIDTLTKYAKKNGIPVWITAYTQQFTNVDEYGVQIGEANVANFNKIAEDPNVYGVQIYEWDPKGARFQHAFNILKKELNYIPRRVIE